MEQPKYLAVESIRGFACFMVVLSHLSLIFFPYLHSFGGKTAPAINPFQSFIHESPLGFFYSGTSAVFIFFVLSGYILTKVAIKNNNSKKIISMTIKRYPRLMVPALASCILAYFAFQLFELPSALLPDYGDFSSSLIGAIYSGVIDVFFLSGQSLYNPVLWTMKIELIGSFIIFFLCFNKIKIKLPYLSTLFIITTPLLVVFKIINPDLGLGIFSFVIGYLFCIYGRMINKKLSFTLFFIGLYLAGAHNESLSYLPIISILGNMTYKLCNFASGFFIVYAIIFNKEFNTLLSGNLGVFMGKVSFSVYLIHMPILATLGVFTFNIFFDYFNQYAVAAILSSIVSILSTYTASLLFYKAVDLQGVKFSNFIGNSVTPITLKLSKLIKNRITAKI